MKNFARTPVVYLAGGMRSNWQDIVIRAFPGVMFIDPRTHQSKDEAVYTGWDLTGVQLCDIVFGNIEADNPNGAGLALEFGYAAALGKHIVYVEAPHFPFSRYFGMVRSVSDISCSSLEQGMAQLAHLCGFRNTTQCAGPQTFALKWERPKLCLP